MLLLKRNLGKVLVCFETISVCSVVEFLPVVCGISLEKSRVYIFGSKVSNAITEDIPLCNGGFNMVLYF